MIKTAFLDLPFKTHLYNILGIFAFVSSKKSSFHLWFNIFPDEIEFFLGYQRTDSLRTEPAL